MDLGWVRTTGGGTVVVVVALEAEAQSSVKAWVERSATVEDAGAVSVVVMTGGATSLVGRRRTWPQA